MHYPAEHSKYPPFNSIKVVIFGVDPTDIKSRKDAGHLYLSFWGKLNNDTGLKYPISRRTSYDFSAWYSRGVCFLENSSYHTTEALSKLSSLRKNLVFIVYGFKNQYRIKWIRNTCEYSQQDRPFTHLILTHKDKNIFSKANAFLEKAGIKQVNWRLDG